MKVCKTCQQDKPIEDFRLYKKKAPLKDVRGGSCLACTNLDAKQRMANRMGTQQYKEWLDSSRVMRRKLKAKYRREAGIPTVEERKVRTKAAHEETKRIKQSMRLHDAHVRAFFSDDARKAAWRVRHDQDYVINQRMRVAIRKALKGGKAGRSWESIVGYTVHELKAHLIKSMPKGRTWDDVFNGSMHIDHIVPKSKFNLSDPCELKIAWGLPNLRLLDSHINLSKGSKCIFLL